MINEIQNEMLQLGVYALMVRGEQQDLLMGKNVNDYIEVKGLEALLHSFIFDLDQYFAFIYKEEIPKFLEAMQSRLKINLMELQSNLEQNIHAMKEFDSEDVIIWYLVITKTLEYLRHHIFQTIGWDMIKNQYQLQFNKPLSNKIFAKLKEFNESDNPEFSLLYNLIFVQYLARIYDNLAFQQKCDKIIQSKIQKIFKILNPR